MNFLICIKGKNKLKLLRTGNTVDHLTMVMSICKDVAERIAIEKNISLCTAMNFVLDCIVDTKDSLK